MAWGNKQEKQGVQVEFDNAGKTYRVELSQGEATPYYIANSLVDEVARKTDLLTGQDILIVWRQVGVLRFV